MIYFYENIDEEYYNLRHAGKPRCIVLTKGSPVVVSLNYDAPYIEESRDVTIFINGESRTIVFKSTEAAMTCVQDINTILTQEEGTYPEMLI